MVKIYVHGGSKKKNMVSGVYCNYKDININYSKRVGQGSKKNSQELGLCYAIEIIKSLGINEEIKIYSSNNKLSEILTRKIITDKDIKEFPMINEINRFMQSNNIELEFISKRKNQSRNLIKEAGKGIFYNEVGIVKLQDLETKKGRLMKVIFNGPSNGVINYEEVIA